MSSYDMTIHEYEKLMDYVESFFDKKEEKEEQE